MDQVPFPAIVFLGNPGSEYRQSRHNFGWLFADFFEQHCSGLDPVQKKFKGEYRKLRHSGGSTHLLRPTGYYNRSGEPARQMLSFFKIPPDDVLVVHDNLELPFGIIVLQKAGGMAGNNGLRSLKQELGTDAFYRLSFGIGRPRHGSPEAWVLGRFSKEEEPELPLLFEKAGSLIRSLSEGDLRNLKAGQKIRRELGKMD